MSSNKVLLIVLISCMVILNGCHIKRLTTNRAFDSFLYKPEYFSPVYLVKLPPHCKLEYLIIGSSTSYYFSYNNAYFYISDESPAYGDSVCCFGPVYNNLLKAQDSLKKGMPISSHKQGRIYEKGGDTSLWKYCMRYDLEKPDPVSGAGFWGFEYLVVGYTHAAPGDTNVLNSLIDSALKLEMPVKKNKFNKIVKYKTFFP